LGVSVEVADEVLKELRARDSAKRLLGTSAMVAGAGSAIGAATAARLAAEWAAVERVAAEIVERGGEAIAVGIDSIDGEPVDRLVSRTAESFGKLNAVHIDVADLSAQTARRDTDVRAVPLEVLDRTIAVNLRGHLVVIKQVLPEPLSAGGASIVHTASAGAFVGGSSLAAYGRSKAGLLTLSPQVATTWGKDGIRSNVVSPGLILRRRIPPVRRCRIHQRSIKANRTLSWTTWTFEEPLRGGNMRCHTWRRIGIEDCHPPFDDEWRNSL
jgi:NAD(P)-dependent dehydrogenase (short-subunit alcohol dehydrogenase family)